MNEKAPLPGSDTEVLPYSAVSAYEDIVSPESMARFGERIAQESENFNFDVEQASAQRDQDALMSQMQALMSDGSLSDDQRDSLSKELIRQFDALDFRQSEAPKLKNFMEMRKHIWDTRGGMLLSSLEDEAQPLINGLMDSAKKEESDFVPEEAFTEVLDKNKPNVIIDASSKPIEVPLSAVVSAVGFRSWENGRSDGIGKGSKSSSETIKDYASRSTEIPPIDSAVAVILPNGEVVIMSENSHRVAAAKLRGQKTILIKHLTVSEAQKS